MSHCITQLDNIITPEDSKFNTWHGLDKKVGETITRESCETNGLFPNLTLEPLAYSNSELNVVGDGVEANAVTAHTTKGAVFLGAVSERYSLIQNSQVWEMMSRSLDKVGSFKPVVTCTGTLDGLRKYFISVELNNGKDVEMAGESYKANLNFITSHDGTLAFKVYDSCTRIVCMNTLNSSLALKGKLSFSVRHKGDVKSQILDLETVLSNVFKQRENLSETLVRMKNADLTEGQQRELVGGYFLAANDDFKDAPTRTQNNIMDVLQLARTGRGNSGETAHDVFQGATEFWTSGRGVGLRTTEEKRVSNSEFGAASEHKAKFFQHVVKELSLSN